jgi:hypothetical protein
MAVGRTEDGDRGDKFQTSTTSPKIKEMRKQSRITHTDEHEGRDEYWKVKHKTTAKRRQKKSARKKLRTLSSKEVSDEAEENGKI